VGWGGGGIGGGGEVDGKGDEGREAKLETVGVIGVWRVRAGSGVVPADTPSPLRKWVGIVAEEFKPYIRALCEIFELGGGPNGRAGCGARRWFLEPTSSTFGGITGAC